MKRLLFVVCALALMSMRAEAQSISIESAISGPFCAGERIFVDYSVSGSFTDKNSFVVQLSDDTGTFDSFTNIGSLRAQVSGRVPVTIPSTTGNRFRLRVIATDPYFEGTQTDQNIVIAGPPIFDERFFMQNLRFGMVGETMELTHSMPSEVASYEWQVLPDGVVENSSDPIPRVSFVTPGFKSYRVVLKSAQGCERVLEGEMIYIATCSPAIPNYADIDSTVAEDKDSFLDQRVWVVPGGILRSSKLINYVDAGGTVNSVAGRSIVYVKSGGSVTVAPTDGRNLAIIYEEGSSIRAQDSIYRFKCPNLEFDYTDAPPYKIQPASVSRVKGSSVQVYPNPVADRLTIEHKESLLREIIIRNALGAEMMFVQPEGLGKTSIDVSRLAAGLYFLDIIGEQGIETQKIVISR